MRPRKVSAAGRASLLLAMAGTMFLASCGSGGTGANIALPVVTLSPATAKVPEGGSQQFTAMIVSPTSTTITWYVNDILGGNSKLGTVNASGLYMAPASAPNPATVTVKALSSAETGPSGSALVTITSPPVRVKVSVSPTNSSVAAGSTLQFTAGVTGTSNTFVQWAVNGVVGGNSTVGTITPTGLYTAPATLPNPATVTITATSAADANSSSSASITITVPAVQLNLSPGNTSIWAGSTMQFTATVTGSTSPTDKWSWSVNGAAGGTSTVGTICNAAASTCTFTQLYTAPAAVPSPATVTVTATISGSVNASASASVTILVPVVEGIGPTDSSVPVGATLQFTASVIPSNATDLQWWVNGIAGGSSTLGTINSSGLYTPPSSVPNPPTVVVTVTGQADTTDSASTSLTVTASNAAPLYVNFGPNGNTGNPNTAFYNGIFTPVTVCLPGTNQCQTIPNVLVDTGSVGFRVLNSALTTVPASDLTTIRDSSNNQVQECVQFGDTSYAWGPVLVADVAIAGEKASAVPIQVIGDTTFNVPANCLSLGQGPSLDTVAALGANGILGVGNTIQDCGLNCAGGQTFSGYPYYVCPRNACQVVPVPVAQQVTNPVAFFTKDNNGVEILLPAISSAGAPSLPYVNLDGSGLIPAGLLVFGVGTESNNALGNATLFPLDSNGHFPNVVYNGTSYVSEGFLDTRSNALYVLNAQALGIQGCADNPYYCPASTLPVSLTICGANAAPAANLPCGTAVPAETVPLSIANADTLFDDNPGFAAFSNLGGDSGNGLSTVSIDLGLPFFFGRSVFVGIAGMPVPNNVSASYGYFAF